MTKISESSKALAESFKDYPGAQVITIKMNPVVEKACNDFTRNNKVAHERTKYSKLKVK